MDALCRYKHMIFLLVGLSFGKMSAKFSSSAYEAVRIFLCKLIMYVLSVSIYLLLMANLWFQGWSLDANIIRFHTNRKRLYILDKFSTSDSRNLHIEQQSRGWWWFVNVYHMMGGEMKHKSNTLWNSFLNHPRLKREEKTSWLEWLRKLIPIIFLGWL